MFSRFSREPETPDLAAMMHDVVQKVATYNPRFDKDRLWQAYRLGSEAHSEQKRHSGEPYFIHALTVTDILADLRMDVDTLISGLLHDVVEDTPVELNEIEAAFGPAVARIVGELTNPSSNYSGTRGGGEGAEVRWVNAGKG